ncbi:MAG TPA: bifunctional serine/threonine-protein kinase/formylglycine-generating enzyme family protein [Gemmataceae bacterium]|nr:bifunctional serine/threonine-protein kinase/formylglycine-generating enzyme family protein [Gemmataceae bacterium]
MSGCPSHEQLESFVDERLTGPERSWLEGHVSACRACQQALEEVAIRGDGAPLRSLRTARAEKLEPRGDLLVRIEQAGFAASRSDSRSDVIVAATGPYASPAPPIPGISGAHAAPDQPTRPGPPPGVLEDAATILQPGTILGQYRILEQLGAGGMGHVYKAVHVAMDRVVALKVIAPHLLRDPRARARFQQEVRTAAKLHHPNIVMAHDAAEANGLSFLVMEHVEGTTLSTLVGEHGLPPAPLACEIVRQAAMGLQHAQDKGMVHRDIKPGNLMVAAQQTPGGGAIVQSLRGGPRLPGWPAAPLVKILDFGVARLREIGADGEPLKMQTLTQEGCVVGTPEFMSPEQACDSRNVDVRSDIYSLGCTLYYLLAGRPPFSGATALETMFQHLRQPLPPVEALRPGLAPGLVAVVNKTLAKSADERYQTPAELAEALRPWIGEFASSVAPDVRLAQRGLTPTAADSVLAPSTKENPVQAAPAAQPVSVQTQLPTRPKSNAATYLSLALLFIVSAFAFWVILSFFDRPHKPESGPPEDANTNKLGMRVVPVSHGQFHRWFGPAKDDALLNHDLDVAETEVTVGQFSRFVQETKWVTLAEKGDANPRGSFVPSEGKYVPSVNWKQTGWTGDDLPVTCVSWEDAIEFSNWLSKFEGKSPCYVPDGKEWICHFDRDGYRLPTETEWEYVARAGSNELLPVEPSELRAFGWFRPRAEGKPHPVRGLKPNPRGLSDVWGNVWEWCWDWYTEQPTDPNGPKTGSERTVWGGGWNDTPEQLDRNPRKGLLPTHRATDVGFRVVRTVLAR